METTPGEETRSVEVTPGEATRSVEVTRGVVTRSVEVTPGEVTRSVMVTQGEATRRSVGVIRVMMVGGVGRRVWRLLEVEETEESYTLEDGEA